MNFDEASLKAESLLRRLGLAGVSRKVLVCILVIGMVLVFMAVWHFWPRSNHAYSVAQTGSAQALSSNAESTSSGSSAPAKTIVVDVEGAVMAPGLYTLDKGARIGDAIKAAGGFAPDAVLGAANLAQELSDGEQVLVPRMGSSGNIETPGAASSANAKININTASAEDLQKLTGIGPSLSERIVEYRKTNGRFSKIEDLQKVSGIGESRFASIKDKICI
jgi:competence protein ComEA